MVAGHPLRLVVVGRQGAGKGTQCVRVSHRYAIPHISTGDMLRAAVAADSPFGQLAKSFMDRGELVPDSVINGVIAERLEQPDARLRGFVLDGFPRTREQAVALNDLLAPASLNMVINLEVPVDLVLRRLSSRRVCSVCGSIYSDELPPRTPGICDNCGGELIQREDDTEAAILRRLEIYEQTTTPLLGFYTEMNLLEIVDGVGTPEVVLGRISEVLASHGFFEGGR
ncbi:adenylate kinase [Ferrimicrobium acidiphilum]|uniref:Adenylate kinase n=1 Tax=Ferrimicrobium acidiphilum DSM 19497 TaxID=1121877 RepID=A0A0D8FWU5_9ACTN|nr:adenylate kinase [Ferrimicrobium acidiphilum]KJE77728.1 adenylate kinase [Ferrimicrobium acidiphilum DSM 19497]MCL5053789.1 adenylate kinase [Gammaproteobacteria bacterium]